jgi:hypothetical protein
LCESGGVERLSYFFAVFAPILWMFEQHRFIVEETAESNDASAPTYTDKRGEKIC